MFPDLSAPTLLMLAKITSSVAAGEFRKYKINIHELLQGYEEYMSNLLELLQGAYSPGKMF